MTALDEEEKNGEAPQLLTVGEIQHAIRLGLMKQRSEERRRRHTFLLLIIDVLGGNELVGVESGSVRLDRPNTVRKTEVKFLLAIDGEEEAPNFPPVKGSSQHGCSKICGRRSAN